MTETTTNTFTESINEPNEPLEYRTIAENSASIANIYPHADHTSNILKPWFEENYSRFEYLSQYDTSITFTHFFASIKNKSPEFQVNEKDAIKFLLVLKDLASNKHSLGFVTQFFIEKTLEDFYSINDYYDCLALIYHKETKHFLIKKRHKNIDQLQLILQELKKENQLLLNQQEKIIPEEKFLLLMERINNLDKFKLERARDFEKEITEHKMELKLTKDELNKLRTKINEKLTFDPILLESNIKIVHQQIINQEAELYHLNELWKIINKIDLNKIIKEQHELEQDRQALKKELKKIDLVAIYKEQLEKSDANPENKKNANKEKSDVNPEDKNNANPKKSDANPEGKIRKELLNNKIRLEEITLLLQSVKEFIQILFIDNENIIFNFYEKIKLNINLVLFQKERSKKEEISKENNDNDKLLNNQTDLIEFLEINSNKLTELFNILLIESKEAIKATINKLKQKKTNYEIFLKEYELIKKISELKKAISQVKADQQLWNYLLINKIVTTLNYLVKLQEELIEIQQSIEQYKNQLDYFNNKNKKNIFEIDHCKIKLITNLNKYKAKETLNTNYKVDLKNKLKVLKNENFFKYWKIKLTQNERELRFNQREAHAIMTEIELQNLKKYAKKTEALLLKEITSLPKNNSIFFSQQDNLFLNHFTSNLNELKNNVNSSEWNKSGWGFFRKKVPDGIKKMRVLLNKMSLDRVNLSYYERILINFKFFIEIYDLINQKKSYKKCLRSSAVHRFYQSTDHLLESLHDKLKASLDPDWFKLLSTSSVIDNKTAVNVLNKHFFTTITL